MKCLATSFYVKPLSLYLVFALILVTSFASPAAAMFIPAAPQALPEQSRSADLDMIQRALESKTLEQRLMDYGLSPGTAMERINSLPDEQVHQLAAHIASLEAGGRGGGIDTNTLIVILLLVLLIILIVQNGTAAGTQSA